jgi:exoribonuclease R
MSLRPNTDTSALSLGVELNVDGSINVNSVEVTQSTIKVLYRLSYDDVDDMLMEGVGYKEEWQLGALRDAAIKRRNYRKRNGSTEDMIPHPIPQSFVSVHENSNEPDGIGIKVSVDAPHNSGLNNTSESSGDSGFAASDSNLLVTELMVLAGEALGKWKLRADTEPATFCGRTENKLDLPFRAQPRPDFWAREKEYKMLQDLLEFQHGYCHAWYARRFLSPVDIGPVSKPHFGLGVDCYVQWTSPIRRFGDLQVHAVVKRYLRRRRIHDMLFTQQVVPSGLRAVDLGCPVPNDMVEDDGALSTVDTDIDYNWGKSLVQASRAVNRQSQQYWLYEHLARKVQSGEVPTFEGLVLGCVDPERKQYAVYLPEIGYEHRYLSQKGFLQAGDVLQLKVESVNPRQGLMTLTLINV